MKPRLNRLRFLTLVAVLVLMLISGNERYLDSEDDQSTAISLIQPPPKLRAVILILTHPTNQYRRMLQRDTWIKDLESDFIHLYLCANVDHLIWASEGEQQSFITEFETFGDIIVFQGLEEGYRQISKKVIAGIQYAMNLQQASTGEMVSPDYIIKTDDDMYLSISNIEDMLATSPADQFYFGHLKLNQFPDRNEWSKFYVSSDLYPSMDPYPPFAGGGLYILSNDVAAKVSERTRLPDYRYFPFEDVQMGLLMHELKILPHHGNVAIDSEEPEQDTLAIHCGTRMDEYHAMLGKQAQLLSKNAL